jgi:hypothetical protein
MMAAQKEGIIKQKKNWQAMQKRPDGKYGRNWTPILTSQAAAKAEKRDHSIMVTPSQLPTPRQTGAWVQKMTTRWDTANNHNLCKYANKPGQQRKNKNRWKIISYKNNNTRRTSKQQRRNNK